MFEDPYTYDLSEFSLEFTWAFIFWNSAEMTIRQILAELIGGSSASAIAVTADMGNRAVLQGLEAARRELDSLESAEIARHIDHLCSGFGVLVGYRNLYAHTLCSMSFDPENMEQNVKLYGHSIRLKGEGRLRATQRVILTQEMNNFKNYCKSISQYSRAIMNELVEDEWDLSYIVGLPVPSLEKPNWPKSLQSTPHYLQE